MIRSILKKTITQDRRLLKVWQKDLALLVSKLQERRNQFRRYEWITYLEGIGLNKLTPNTRISNVLEGRIKTNQEDALLNDNFMSKYWRSKLDEQLGLEEKYGEDGMEELTWGAAKNSDFVALLISAGLASERNIRTVTTPFPNEDFSRWRLTKQALFKLSA